MIETIARALQGRKQADGSFMVLCPAHADKNPSLHVSQSGEKTLVKCLAGCDQESVISALKSKHLWPEKVNGTDTNRPPGIPSFWSQGNDKKGYVSSWAYHDVNGAVIGYVARYESEGKKDIIPFFKKSGETWKAGASEIPRPIYNLHLLHQNPDKPVLLVEGEKTTDAAERLVGYNYICITWPSGSNATGKADFSPLKGRSVIMWPDADEPGSKAAKIIQDQCHKAHVQSFGIVTPPDSVAQGWDLADALAEGWTREKVLDHIRQNFTEPEKPFNPWENQVDLVSMVHIQPGPVSWHTKERIILGRGFLITGVGGSSKTRLLYHLAGGTILSRLPWSWEISSQGRALLVLTEDTADDVHRITHNLSKSLGLSLEEKQTFYQSLIVYPLAGKDTILLSKTTTGTLEKSKLFLNLTQKIKDLGNVSFVGMDPALSLTDGDELDQGNQRALGKMADDLAVLTGAAVGCYFPDSDHTFAVFLSN